MKMVATEQKGSLTASDDSAVVPASVSTSFSFPSCLSSTSTFPGGFLEKGGNETRRSNSGDVVTESLLNGNQLHLQVPVQHPPNSISTGSNYSQQSSPRPSTTTLDGDIPVRNRGNSSSSSLSFGEISYHRDLSDIQDEFKILKILHQGTFSKVLLVKADTSSNVNGSGSDSEDSSGNRRETSSGCRNSGVCGKYLVLKAIPSGGLFTEDFKQELRHNYFLSPHPNIVTSFNISFNWASCYNVFVQEHAPFGDLSKYVSNNTANRKCLPECQVKLIASQLASALEFMHSFNLVHQDLQAANVLVFKSNMSQVKLCDFGCTRKEGTLMTKGSLLAGSSSSSSNILAPELSYLLPQEKYESHRSADVWQMGILLCTCLTGKSPWENAEFSDPIFRQYTSWIKRKCLKVPEPFRKFTPRMIRLLKRLMEPKQHLRSEIREVFKYLKDDWVKPNCSNRTMMMETNSNCSNINNMGSSSKKNNKKMATVSILQSLHKKMESQNSSGVDDGGISSSAATGNKTGKLIMSTKSDINLLGHHSTFPPCRSTSPQESRKSATEDLFDNGNNCSNNKLGESKDASNGVAVEEGKLGFDGDFIEASPVDTDGVGEGEDGKTNRVENWVASTAALSVVAPAVVMQQVINTSENCIKNVECDGNQELENLGTPGLEETD